MQYNKLVRDKIPEIIKSNGGKCITHIAEDLEFKEKLKEKLVEEAQEFREAKDHESEKEELADILEVIDAIYKSSNFDKDEIEKIKREKHDKRGGFSKKIILEKS